MKTVAITKDNRYIVSGSKDGSITVFDLVEDELIWTIPHAHERKRLLFLIGLILSIRLGDVSDNKFR